MSATQSSSLGPRKRKESSRITDNMDPLLDRNKKVKLAPKAPTKRPVMNTNMRKKVATSNREPVTKTKVNMNTKTTITNNTTSASSSWAPR